MHINQCWQYHLTTTVLVSESLANTLSSYTGYRYQYRWSPVNDTSIGIGIANVHLQIQVSVSLRPRCWYKIRYWYRWSSITDNSIGIIERIRYRPTLVEKWHSLPSEKNAPLLYQNIPIIIQIKLELVVAKRYDTWYLSWHSQHFCYYEHFHYHSNQLKVVVPIRYDTWCLSWHSWGCTRGPSGWAPPKILYGGWKLMI